MRGDIGTKGVEGVAVSTYESARDRAEMDSDEGIQGPDDEYKEERSPDNGKRACYLVSTYESAKNEVKLC